MAIKKDDIIKVEYIGTLDNGEVFDSTEMNEGKPLKFQVGSGQLISGFDNSVIGKEVGNEYEIRLEPNEAYGDYKEGLIQSVPKEQFPEDQKPQKGMMIVLLGPNQQQIPATIKEVKDETIDIDLNHPMAGKSLNFKIKILETGCEPDPPSACGCGCGHEHHH